MHHHILPNEKVVIENVSDNFGVLALSGPNSRKILTKLTKDSLDNESFKWMNAKSIEILGIRVRALRVSYVGELGWEIHSPIKNMDNLYDSIMEAGSEFGIVNFGTYAMNSLRIEKAYKGWGTELTTEITPMEADLERFINFRKEFIGRDATLSRKLIGIGIKLVYISLETNDVDCLGNEPVLDNEEIIGVTTSGAYGHTVDKSLAFAYVQKKYSEPDTEFEVRILGKKYKARVIKGPIYDPKNLRLLDI